MKDGSVNAGLFWSNFGLLSISHLCIDEWKIRCRYDLNWCQMEEDEWKHIVDE